MPLRLQDDGAPVYPAVGLATAKGHLRVDHSDDDPMIGLYLEAAIGVLDGRDGQLGRALATQSWALDLDGFPPCNEPILVPLPPLQAVTGVTYIDAAGDAQTLDPGGYIVHPGELAMVELAPGGSWPCTSRRRASVTVAFTAGYGDPTEKDGAAGLPKPIASAVLLMVGDLYANRETAADGLASTIPMSLTVERLLAPFRVLR